VRFGILGYGAIAAKHADALTKLGCTLVAVAGPNLESAVAFAEAHGVTRAHDSVDEVVSAGDVDVVVVASPSGVHSAQTIAALERGKHVLCEVPLGLSLEETERVTQLSLAGDRCVMVCQTQRFLRPLASIRERIARDVVRHVVIRLVLNRTTNVGITGRVRSWTDDLVWHHGSHAVDTALWLLAADVTEVLAVGSGSNDAGSPMDAGVLLRATNGALATIALSYRADRPSTDVLAVCDRDTFRYEGGTLSSRGTGVQEFDEDELFTDAVQRQDAVFVEAVSRGAHASPTPLELSGVYSALSLVTREIRLRLQSELTPKS
jgi:2-hydroxy-4-carboxymuconate semialdehyde hemiacetal dehydrogenase